MIPATVPTADFAALLGMSGKRFWLERRRGRIPAPKFPGRPNLWTREQVNAVLDGQNGNDAPCEEEDPIMGAIRNGNGQNALR